MELYCKTFIKVKNIFFLLRLISLLEFSSAHSLPALNLDEEDLNFNNDVMDYDGYEDGLSAYLEETSQVSTYLVDPKTSSLNPCAPNHFYCDEYCIHYHRVCDGRADCPNAEDEQECHLKSSFCPPHFTNCYTNDSLACIHDSLKCDGVIHCQDADDEINCGNENDCQEFRCHDNTCVPFSKSCDGFEDCPDGTDESQCLFCEVHQAQCNDGSCISKELYCDGNNDCIDGSDEEDCEMENKCEGEDFRCDKDRCIEGEKYCDGKKDCSDGSDENNCLLLPESECKSGEFQCGDRRCIDKALVCNRAYDCDDATDELNCYSPAQCRYEEFQCGDGSCIDARLTCNTIPDCPDRSDEETCQTRSQCREREFQCGDGSCIDARARCNSYPDCPDRSDEDNCPAKPPCKSDEFQCKDGNCIATKFLCNKEFNCPDGEDELNCEAPVECRAEEFQCGDGSCIDVRLKCNSYPDCRDRSDEDACESPVQCQEREFQCGDGSCIDVRLKCNSYPDCRDRSDEDNCPAKPQCKSDEFQCKDGNCILTKFVCNKEFNCPDGTDELNCEEPVACRAEEFQCGDGSCIDARARCNSYPDCRDRSDEDNCQVPQPECTSEEFRCGDGTCISRNLVCNRVYNCNDGADELNCAPDSPVECRAEEFQCGDGSCIDARARCNNYPDCRDRSDEDNCPKPQCKSDEFQCKDGNCISTKFICNKEFNCPDGTDELNCDQPVACKAEEFQCGDGSCIDVRLKCNSYPDCRDRSDEDNCQVPQPECTSEEFKCGDGTCITRNLVCNRAYNCNDGADELNCEPERPVACRADEFQCGDGSCIDVRARCNNYPDCPDRSDEDNCPPQCKCTSEEFKCGDGACISRNLVCNREYNCNDGADELNCDPEKPVACRAEEFQCGDGSCIDVRLKCNSYPDCRDRSDEDACESPVACRAEEFQCGDGSCIDVRLKCNSYPDCRDRSDEDNCQSPEACKAEEFQCGDGSCIDARARCNSYPDCRDRSDEDNCLPQPECTSEEFKCGDGTCISRNLVCNRAYNCNDGADELNCEPEKPVACRAEEFQCGDGSCIDIRLKCNSYPDCRDRSDEDACESPVQCQEREFQCGDGSCIDVRLKCNSYPDCPDRSDEDNCHSPAQCRAEEFQCGDGSCIDARLKCNTIPDCADRSDEENCHSPVACRAEEFQCGDGSCIDARARCNSYPDCPDRSDEDNCRHSESEEATVTPSKLQVRTGIDVSFICRSNLPPSFKPQWLNSKNVLPTNSMVENFKLTILRTQVDNSDTYYCRLSDGERVVVARAVLVVERIENNDDSHGHCRSHEVPCANGKCINKGYFCDGDADCEDKSDELNCSLDELCEPNQVKCKTGQCVSKLWRCDGEDDCKDGTDELHCIETMKSRSNGNCTSKQFSCASLSQCIPYGYYCDGEVDCQDASDEDGCLAPSVTKAPKSELTAEEGDIVVMECEAIGVPPPYISWRLNWGHVGEAPRVTESVVYKENRGKPIVAVGRIRIEGVRKSDEGAYTCEVFNNKGSVMAVPDTILHVITAEYTTRCTDASFNSKALTPLDCLQCFCFNKTDHCQSSSLFLQTVQENTVPTIVDRHGTVIEHRHPHYHSLRSYQGSYWLLPEVFTRNKVTSYSGELRFTLSQVDYALFKQSRNNHDVIMKGGGTELQSKCEVVKVVDDVIQCRIQILEPSWRLPNGESTSKEALMGVLRNVSSVMVSRFYNQHRKIEIKDVSLTITTDVVSSEGRAYLVESCQCPHPYTGSSCEKCLPGFYMKLSRNTKLGLCLPCRCPSGECDSSTGLCKECHQSYCKTCGWGSFLQIDSCSPCACSTDRYSNFTTSCSSDGKGSYVCDDCLSGYTGLQCQQCDVGYVMSYEMNSAVCISATSECDENGSVSKFMQNGWCECKDNVEGSRCERCKPGYFGLSKNGCSKCWCGGVTSQCTLLEAYWTENRLNAYDLKLVSLDGHQLPDNYEHHHNEVTYNLPQQHQSDLKLYWNLSSVLPSNPLMAYGSSLTFELFPKLKDVEKRDRIVAPDIKLLSGNKFYHSYFYNYIDTSQHKRKYSIQLHESNFFKRSKGKELEKIDKEEFMHFLSSIKYLLVRGVFFKSQETSTIGDVVLKEAREVRQMENMYSSENRVLSIEQCTCPPQYGGYSCEKCADAYEWRHFQYESSKGECVLKPVTDCQCHGNSNRCDPRDGHCLNCQNNTGGKYCGSCVEGYYGNPSLRILCRPCSCDQFDNKNSNCYLDDDGLPTCANCSEGLWGRHCEKCKSDSQNAKCKKKENEVRVVVRPSELVVTEGDEVNMECKVSGNVPNLNIYWAKDGDPRLPNDVIKRGENDLYIRSVRMEHAGRYECEVVSAVGRISGRSVLVVQERSRYFEVGVLRPELRVLAGEDAKFECVAKQDSGLPPGIVDLKWTRRNGEALGGNCVDDGSGNLEVKKVEAKDEGEFLCTGHDKKGFKQASARLEVVEPDVRIKVTVVSEAPKDGDAVELRCSSSYWHVQRYDWHKTNGELPTGVKKNGERMYIPHVRPEDSGRYVCTLYLPGGNRHFGYTVLHIPTNNNVPKLDIKQDSVVAWVNDVITIECYVTNASPSDVTWTRVEGPLNSNVEVDNNKLVVKSFSQSDIGTYRCSVSNQYGRASASIAIKMTKDIFIEPYYQVFVEESSFSMKCVTPYPQCSTDKVTWERVDGGTTLSKNAVINGNQMFIKTASWQDEGVYKCVFVDQYGRSTQAFATAVLKIAPIGLIHPVHLEVHKGSTATLTCQGEGSKPLTTHWTKLKGFLPKKVVIMEHILRIPEMGEEDQGVYICSIGNIVGQYLTNATIVLYKELVNTPVEEMTMVEGQNLKFDCNVELKPEDAKVGWKFFKGRNTYSNTTLPHTEWIASIFQTLPLTSLDSGLYICEDLNIQGRLYKSVLLRIAVLPKVWVDEKVKVGSLGDVVELHCRSEGYPPPDVVWEKMYSNVKSPHHKHQQGHLLIEGLKRSDFGDYKCLAHNQHGVARDTATITRTESLPRFTQSQNSYLIFSFDSEPNDTQIQLSIKPESDYGLIVFSSNIHGAERGDFFMLSLEEGRIVMMVNTGSGSMFFESEPISLGQWHLVSARVVHKSVILIVDGEIHKRQIKSSLTSLNLDGYVYVGGLPDYQMLPSDASDLTGFEGCMGRLSIKGEKFSLSEDANTKVGLGSCDECAVEGQGVCERGTCQNGWATWGFLCSCPPDRSGIFCHRNGNSCSAVSCDAAQKCIDLLMEGTYKCSCPLGLNGQQCSEGKSIEVPFFDSYAYASYPTMKGVALSLKLFIKFKSLSSGSSEVLLYNGFEDSGQGDFIALVVVKRKLQLLFDLGSGLTVVEDGELLKVGEWHTAEVVMDYGKTSLRVDQKEAIHGSPSHSKGLNIKSRLYLGGLDLHHITPNMGMTFYDGFYGCVSELSVQDQQVDLTSAIDSLNLQECQHCSPLYFDGAEGERCAQFKEAMSSYAKVVTVQDEDDPEILNAIEASIQASTHSSDTIAVLLRQSYTDLDDIYFELTIEIGFIVFNYYTRTEACRLKSSYMVNNGYEHHISIIRKDNMLELLIDGEDNGSCYSSNHEMFPALDPNIYIGGFPVYPSDRKYFQGTLRNVKINKHYVNFTDDDVTSQGLCQCNNL